VTRGAALMTIGDFARATRLTAKALRFYHGEGLLVPALVDPANGYRRYSAAQLGDAQVIRSLRELEVPVDEIRTIVTTSDVAARAQVLEEHVVRLEALLRQTSDALRTLRGVLDPTPRPAIPIAHRSEDAVVVLGIEETIDLADLGPWFQRTMVDLREAVDASDVRTVGPFGGVWSTALFLEERGSAMLHVPIAPDAAVTMPRGRAAAGSPRRRRPRPGPPARSPRATARRPPGPRRGR